MKAFLQRITKWCFFAFVVYPIVNIVLGVNVRRRDLLPKKGPALVIINHNSHLDTMVMMVLLGLGRLDRVRPVGAADYFMSNPLMRFFSRWMLDLIPLDRKMVSRREDPLKGICEALEKDTIVVIFPEGSRGEPERMSRIKPGVAHLAKRYPDLPVTTVYTHGLGKALPKGEAILVPFVCDVYVAEPITWSGDKLSFMEQVGECFTGLEAEHEASEWIE